MSGEMVVSSDIAKRHKESLWPSDSRVPVLIPRVRSISYADSSQKDVLAALATRANSFTKLPFLQRSRVMPTAGVPPRRQLRRELHGTPRGGTPKNDPKEKRHKSPKPSAVAKVVEIDAESPAESSSSSEEEESESEPDDSLSISPEQESSSSGE